MLNHSLPIGGCEGSAGELLDLLIIDRLKESWTNFGNGFLNIIIF